LDRSQRRSGQEPKQRRSWCGQRGSASIFSPKAGSYYGFKTDPHSFALGFRLDPIHAAVHFVWGMVGTYIGFFRPRYATPFVLSFAAFYTVMAVLGTFTPYHLGMMLNDQVNLFHWFLVPPAWAIGLYGLWRERHPV
jgi:Domain of unknown function (DUF4383)